MSEESFTEWQRAFSDIEESIALVYKVVFYGGHRLMEWVK